MRNHSLPSLPLSCTGFNFYWLDEVNRSTALMAISRLSIQKMDNITTLVEWSTHQDRGGGRNSNTSVVHMHNHRNAKKGVVFWDWMWFVRITIRGQNVPVFKKKGTFLNSTRGIQESFFNILYSTKPVPKKFLFRVIFLIRATLY